MRFNNYVATLVIIASAVVAGCGGGGGNAGTPNGGSGTNTSTNQSGSNGQSSVVTAGFIYQLDKNSLTNSGLDKVLLTVTALDSKNNPVPGASVAVQVDSGVYTPKSATTDSSGLASGEISIGGSKINRTIKATVTVGTNSTVVSIPVIGSQVTLTPVPGTANPGAPVDLAIRVVDVNSVGIANTPVVLSGSLGFTQTVTTDVNGLANAKLGAAPTSAGTYSIDVATAGVSSRRDVQVVAAGGGGIPAVTAVVATSNLAINPNTIAPNAAGSSSNRAGLRAVFQDSSNRGIQNIRVRFEIVSPSLDPAESISTGSTTVYSDSSGIAIADYIAGARSSPTNGVMIRACFGRTDDEIAGSLCPNSVSANLTVASQPLSITLGDNNELSKGANNLTYIKLFDIAVVDAAGNAVPNAQISASVDLVNYGKGRYVDPRTFCPNEDTNRNGFLEDSERLAGDGDNVISPRKADISLSFVGANTTGTNGRTNIRVEYPQNVATWLQYDVKVTTSVAGSEGTATKRFVTSFVMGDEVNGSFLTPPYGVNGCRTPN